MASSPQAGRLERTLRDERLASGHRPEFPSFGYERRLRHMPLSPAPTLGSTALVVQLPSGHPGPRRSRERMEPTAPRGIFDAFVKTCQRWRLNPDDQLTLLGYQVDDFVGRQVLAGRMMPASRDVRDRVGYVVGISLGLSALFGDSLDAENLWLRTERRELRGQSPLDYMLEGRMINLIKVSDLAIHERGL